MFYKSSIIGFCNGLDKILPIFLKTFLCEILR